MHLQTAVRRRVIATPDHARSREHDLESPIFQIPPSMTFKCCLSAQVSGLLKSVVHSYAVRCPRAGAVRRCYASFVFPEMG